MPNTVERHSSWRSERRTERGSDAKDPRHNPNFDIDRSNPTPTHSYADAHTSQTFMQKLLGVGAQANDFSRIRGQYNKKIYKPGKRELKQEYHDAWRKYGRRKDKEEHQLYRRAHQLEDRLSHETDPRKIERLQDEFDREKKRADEKFGRFVETEERTLEHTFRYEEKELRRDRTEALRTAREELNDRLRGESNDDEELSIDKLQDTLA